MIDQIAAAKKPRPPIARQVHAQLADEGIIVSDRVVRELMADQGLESCHPRPWRHLTQPDGTPRPAVVHLLVSPGSSPWAGILWPWAGELPAE